jgi:hypothetical protein
MELNTSFTVCPQSGALVFHKPKFVKEQEATIQATEELKKENQLLKTLLAELVAAQSQTVKSKLSPELVAALSDSPELQAE